MNSPATRDASRRGQVPEGDSQPKGLARGAAARSPRSGLGSGEAAPSRGFQSSAACFNRRAALILTGIALALVGGGAAILILALGHHPLWAVIWIAAGLLACEIVLAWSLHRRPGCKLDGVARSLIDVLDAQAQALDAQGREIARLQETLADTPGLGQVRGVLAAQTTPNLSSLIDRLAQAEESLPDMLPQTRAWVAEVRRLATHAAAQVEALRDEVAGPGILPTNGAGSEKES
jgi:hypothetical protein